MCLTPFKTFAVLASLVMIGTASAADDFAGDSFVLSSYEDLLSRVEELEAERGDYLGSPDAYCEPQCCSNYGFYAAYENVVVAPLFSRNVAWVEQIGNSDELFQESFNWDLKYSPRVELGYVACCGWGMRARYWQFDHSATERQLADQPIRIHPIADEPNIAVRVGAGDIAEAIHILELHVIDLEALYKSSSCGGYLLGSVGVRYVRMDQTLVGNEFDGPDGPSATGILEEFLLLHHSFEGAGPTFAAEGLHRIGGSRLGVYLKLRGSILFGESDLDGIHPNGPDSLQADDITLVPVGEIGMGFDYTMGSFFARIGLEAQYWVNAGSANTQLGGNSHNDPRDADMGFVGLNVATGVNW